MRRLPLSRSRCLTALSLAAGLCLAATAWACPDSKRAGHCPQPTDETGSETTLGNPVPEPEAEGPVLAGVAGPAARFRDGDSRPNDGPFGWLLSSGPMGGLKLASERLARAPERKAGAVAETRASRPVAKRSDKSRGGGAVGHIAKPHRMPSLEIL